MQPSIPEEIEVSNQNKPLSIARQMLKEKKKAKAASANMDLQIEKIMGITSKGKNSFAYNPVTGDLAYPAGSIAILYNPKTNKQTRYFFSTSRKSITALCFSPDGKYLAIATKGLDINIWDLHSNSVQPTYILKGHKYGIENIMFSPNMKYFVSIGDANDKGLFIWDWTQGVILTKNKVNKRIISASFTSSGQHLVTAGEQHLKFWFFDAMGNILFSKPKDGNMSIKDNASDISVATNATSSNTNIIEGKSANLGKMGDKVFMDIAYQNFQVFAITLDGILCIINENTRSIEKWMDLKVPSGFSVLTTRDYLISACGDGFIRFFKISTMEHIFVLPKPPSLGSYNIEKGVVTKLASHPNEKYADAIAITYDEKNHKMATLYSDRTIFIWDVKNIDKIVVYRSFLNHSGAVYDIQPLPAMSSYEITFFATGSNDKTVRIWHLADSGDKENEKVIKRNAYSKNLSRILYINENYDHFKNQVIPQDSENYVPQDYQIRCIKCSPEGEYLATGDQVGFLRIFALATFQLVQELKAHDQEILCMDYSPDNEDKVKFLATGSRDRLIHVYDITKGFNIVTTLDDHTSSISSLRFCYDKSTKKLGLVSCGADKTIIFRMYNAKIKNFETTHVEVDKNNKFHSLELNHEGTQIVAGQDKKISIWQVDTGKQKCVYDTKDEDINAKNAYLDNLRIVVDVTGSYIAISNKDAVRIRDYFSGNLIAKINCGDFSTGMCFTQNNKNLITTTADGCVLVWKLPEDMTNNMDRKKNQLGIIVKKLREMLETDANDYSLLKDFKYDSLLIEKELKEYVAKQNQEEKPEGGQLIAELQAITDQITKKEGPVTPTMPRETMDPDKFARIFNTSELPAWARTTESIARDVRPTEKKEEKPVTGGKWRTRLESEQGRDYSRSPMKQQEAPIKEENEEGHEGLGDEGGDSEEKEEAGEDLQIPQKKEELVEDDSKKKVAEEKAFKPVINLGHGVQIGYPNVEKENIEEDILEEGYQDDKDVGDQEIEEKIEGEGQGNEAGKLGFVSPSRGAMFDNWKFIEQNYEELDKEPAVSPLKSPVDKESLSSIYRQAKGTKEGENKSNQASPGAIEVFDLGEDEERKNVLKYKVGGAQPRETLFDVNAIKSQVSNINKKLEDLENQLATNKDPSKAPKSFQVFDQSRTFLSTFDIGDLEKNQSAFHVDESEIHPVTEKSASTKKDARDKSPGLINNKYTPEKKQDEKERSANPTPNNSGVLKVDKRNLVPTTLEKLQKKVTSTPPPNSSKKEYEEKLKSNSGSKEKVSHRDDEIEAENPHQLMVESERYENRFTLQATESPTRLPEKVAGPFVGQGQKEGNQYGWIQNTSTFNKAENREDILETEMEESFNVIKAHLSKIDNIMRGLSIERNSSIKERLMDKFDKGYEETRRSVDSLGVRTSRSGMSQFGSDVSQNMSELVISNSKDLLENYSKLLVQTFEKHLQEKLAKK